MVKLVKKKGEVNLPSLNDDVEPNIFKEDDNHYFALEDTESNTKEKIISKYVKKPKKKHFKKQLLKQE